MRIPTERKREFQRRRNAAGDAAEPGTPLPRKRFTEDGDNELVTCTACKTRNVVATNTDLRQHPCVHC